MVNQLQIQDREADSDGILYINGLPLVVFEFKSAIREEATIQDAYVVDHALPARHPGIVEVQRAMRDHDGVNNKMGSLFAA